MCFFCSCLMFTSIMIVYKYFNVLIFQNVIIILFITIIVHHHINDLNNRPSLKTFRNTIILLEILLILQKSSVLEHILISWLFVSILYILNLAKQIHKSVKQIIQRIHLGIRFFIKFMKYSKKVGNNICVKMFDRVAYFPSTYFYQELLI